VRQEKTKDVRQLIGTLVVAAGLGLAACTPTVKLEAPDKPIVINLNVKIEQDVRVHVEEDLKQARTERPDLF
jgi:hypothetical protein